MTDDAATSFEFQRPPPPVLLALPPLPVRVPLASIDLSKWVEQQGARRLPEWVVCNRVDDARSEDEDDRGPDPYSAVREWGRPCELCGTSCFVKPFFVTEGFRVTDWFCFRRAGGREVMIHPAMLQEIEEAGYAMMVWEAIGEMRAWLAEPDARGAHAADPPPARWQWLAKAGRLGLLGEIRA